MGFRKGTFIPDLACVLCQSRKVNNKDYKESPLFASAYAECCANPCPCPPPLIHDVPMVTVSLKTENRSSGMEAKQALRLAFGQPSGSRHCSHPQALSGGCDASCEGEPYSLPLSLESHLESWTSILFCTQTSWKHLLYCFSILMWARSSELQWKRKHVFFSPGSELLARRETRLIKCEVWPKSGSQLIQLVWGCQFGYTIGPSMH